jgi:hypothetical protein
VRAERDRRIRSLHYGSGGGYDVLPDDGRHHLRTVAAGLQQKRADIAVMCMNGTIAGRYAERLVAIGNRGRCVMVVMMVVLVMMGAMVMCMWRMMVLTASDDQAVMVMVRQRQPVQTIPQQRNAAVKRQQSAGQQLPIDEPHRAHQ